jgi:SPP1 gp7 family putative phage head morphogenesis protein
VIVAGPVTHEEAAAAIAGKPAVVREVFDRLLPELKGLAFTVSGVQDANVLQRMRDRIADLPRGGDWDAIKKDLVKELSPFLVDEAAEPEVRDAQIKAAARRAELLLRTHGYQAYQATNYRNMVQSAEYLPYWKYVTVRDDQVRESHAALHGLILPWDHPFWQDHFAPWDWGCRCQVIATTDREFERAKTSPTEQAWTLGPEALKRLADGVLDKGDGRPVNVESPRLKAMRAGRNPDTAYAWKPGEARLSVEQLSARYDAPTMAAFDSFAEKTDLGSGVSLKEWLTGKSLTEDQFKFFQSDEAARQYAGTFMDPQARALPDDLAQAASAYQEEGSQWNTDVREQVPLSDEIVGFLRRIDAAMDQFRLHDPIIVYRRTSVSELNITAGMIWSDVAPLSTTLSKSVAMGFSGNTLFELRLPITTRALWLDNLSGYHGHELELLLPRNARLKVLAVELLEGIQYVRCEVLP